MTKSGFFAFLHTHWRPKTVFHLKLSFSCVFEILILLEHHWHQILCPCYEKDKARNSRPKSRRNATLQFIQTVLLLLMLISWSQWLQFGRFSRTPWCWSRKQPTNRQNRSSLGSGDKIWENKRTEYMRRCPIRYINVECCYEHV